MQRQRKTQAFFSSLFGWQIQQAGPAAMIDTGGSGGINGQITSLGHEPHNYVTFYVQVDDLQLYLDKAEFTRWQEVGSTGRDTNRKFCVDGRSGWEHHRLMES